MANRHYSIVSGYTPLCDLSLTYIDKWWRMILYAACLSLKIVYNFYLLTCIDEAMKKIVVLVSGRGSNLGALIAAIKKGAINGEIVCVISDRSDALALEKARHEQIATSVVDAKDASSANTSFEATLIEEIQRYCPDLILLAGFMKILSPDFVKTFEGCILNIHPSLLPAYKGLNTHRCVLEASEHYHGCSVHFVTSELDSGPLIAQARVAVKEDDNPQTLAARVLKEEHRIYPYATALFCADRLVMQAGQCRLDNKILHQPLSLD